MLAYKAMGPEFEKVPHEALRVLREKDAAATVGTILVFYKHTVRALQRWGVWNPRLALLDEPPFDSQSERRSAPDEKGKCVVS